MKPVAVFLLVIGSCLSLLAQQPPAERLPFSVVEQAAYLDALAHGPESKTEHGQTWVVIKPLILGGDVTQTSQRNVCSSSETSTICQQLATYRYSALLGMDDPNDAGAGYLIFLTCDVKFRWNHCDMQEYGQRGGMVLSESGKAPRLKFSILVSTVAKLGDKPHNSQFSVTEVWRMRNPLKP